MSEKIITNNQATIIGEVLSPLTYNNEVFGEKFFTANTLVPRLSGAQDILPIMISDRLMNVNRDYTGVVFEVSGQFRSYNRHNGERNNLVLSVFAREINILTEIPCNKNTNTIYLEGYICKPPTYRPTPLGREITDIMLAVNRPYGRSDYIPCICWGRNAKFADGLMVGNHISVRGRIQSREYQKKISDTEFENRISYEVSVSRIGLVEEISCED